MREEYRPLSQYSSANVPSSDSAPATSDSRSSDAFSARTTASGSAVRTTAHGTPGGAGTAAYSRSTPRLRLCRTAVPARPARAARNSGRSAWFSRVAASARESATTCPSRAMSVIRQPVAESACATASLRSPARVVGSFTRKRATSRALRATASRARSSSHLRCTRVSITVAADSASSTTTV